MERQVPVASLTFHKQAALVFAVFLAFIAVGCHRASVVIPFADSLLVVRFLLAAILAPLPVYWHTRHRADRREAALALYWVLAFSFTLPFVVDVCARSGMPLQDHNLARLDTMLGINVPAFSAWAAHNRIAQTISATYPLLGFVFLPAAMFAPALFGRWMAAREFLIANVIAMLVGLAAFAFLPAVGPWYGYRIPPHPDQLWCQMQLFLMRAPGTYVAQEVGVVCFPSFHVIWAILCTRALWTFRYLRIPAGIFASMIVLSTLTTGWHYFIDVLGGFAVAWLSIYLARRIVHHQARPAHTMLPLPVAVGSVPVAPVLGMAQD
jgi:membrane-associated phospholipid phosphatase